MSEKDSQPQKNDLTIRWILVFCLLLAIAYALFTFFVVNKELAYDPAAVGGLPHKYEISPAGIDRATTHTQTIRKMKNVRGADRNVPGARWTGHVYIEPGTAGRHNVILRVTNIFDKPVTLEEFSAHISRVGDEKQILPGVAFSETAAGEYTAEVTLPDNGEWEVRGRLKKGLEVVLIAQKISAIMPR